jgi:hypothetical protein
MELVELTHANGLWIALKTQWAAECTGFNEDFANYAPGTFGILEPLADGMPDAGIYGLREDGQFLALCQVNVTGLPGYVGPVLRVRFMTFSPRFDFGEFNVQDYARLLTGIFFNIVIISQGDMPARHIKFHFRSLADRQFFAALEGPLGAIDTFETVIIRGMWLYVTKSQ